MGRYPISKQRTVDIHYLHPRHRSMARAMVGGGLTPTELSEMFNLTRSQVSVIINSPLFRAEVARMEALAENNLIDARRELEALKGRSVEVIAEDLFSHDQRLRHQSALDVLDRTGHPKGAPVQKHMHAHAHAHIQNEVDSMNERELYSTVMELIETSDD